jgi:hypothetical protein
MGINEKNSRIRERNGARGREEAKEEKRQSSQKNEESPMAFENLTALQEANHDNK